VADGLARTARAITAAAIRVVLLAFLAADEVFIKVLGIGMATAGRDKPLPLLAADVFNGEHTPAREPRQQAHGPTGKTDGGAVLAADSQFATESVTFAT
jgi:hypothetical protein